MSLNLRYIVYLLVIIIILDLICFKIFESHIKFLKNYTPKPLCITDPITGWTNNPGKYSFFNHQNNVQWICTINSSNERLSYQIENNTNRKINIYGCSFGFGYSVSDTSHYPYILGKNLSGDFNVFNKCVPGYSLVQSYLRFKEDLKNSKFTKNDIVIFEYSDFMLERNTVPNEYLALLRFMTATISNNNTLKVPYITSSQNKNENIQFSIQYKNIKGQTLLEKNSFLILLYNMIKTSNDTKKNFIKYSQLNNLLIEDIYQYCNSNDIKFIVHILDSNTSLNLKNKEVLIVKSEVDIDLDENNSSPYDPEHPNEKTHQFYADNIYKFIINKNLIH